MPWNWQDADWPHFRWDRSRLARAEAMFLEGTGMFTGVSRHLDEAERNGLRVEIISHEAVDTSAIEGERLDRDSVQSSIRCHLGLAVDHRRSPPPEAGIAEMMVKLYQNSALPIDEAMLPTWHSLLMS